MTAILFPMRINLEINQKIIRDAMRIDQHATRKAEIEAGLRLLIQVHGQAGIRRLHGNAQWVGDLDESRWS
jgi:Bacterial antitoxin of type II TA system, VapB